MKTIYKYTDELESFLMYMSDDDLTTWFEKNTIEWSNDNLLEVMLGDKTTSRR